MDACDVLPRAQHAQPCALACRQKAVPRLVPVHVVEQNDLQNDLGVLRLSGLAGAAMNRFVHRIIMSVLLVAALAVIWNVLGAR
jgi:hypothetical protein